MENVVILSQVEYKNLLDEIFNLKNNAKCKSRYFDKYHNEVTANEYINGLLLQISELTEEECLKDSMYCEQRDLVQRLRDDLSKQNTLIQDLEFKIDELEKTNESMIDALDTIRYEANRYL